MTTGAYKLWPLDKDGTLIGDPALSSADPSNPDAVNIYFGVRSDRAEAPPRDQVDLVERIQKVLRTVQILYPLNDDTSGRRARQFRAYYMRLFGLGQVGLEVDNASPDTASAALTTTIADLIDDEAGNVKGKHMRTLGIRAVQAGACCVALYVLLRLTSSYWQPIDAFLMQLGVESGLLANFMLLLLGSFLGVWLSYAIRTTELTLSDLTITDADRLSPHMRLIFAGALTVILGILFAIPLVQVSIGDVAVTDVASYPMLAFVVGCFCGISELALPNVVAKRASDFVQNIK
jgi:hypothetical protein